MSGTNKEYYIELFSIYGNPSQASRDAAERLACIAEDARRARANSLTRHNLVTAIWETPRINYLSGPKK